MKKNLLLFILLAGTSIAFGQFGTCTPDPTYADSAVGVYPLPYDPVANPNGGITKSACKNKPYQFDFNINVPDTVNLLGQMVPLQKLSLATSGAISNLPAGLTYACNPPNCVFDKNTVGCIAIFGTVTNAVPVGDYELLINGTLNIGFNFPFSFPNAALFPGTYILKVEEENSSNCFVVSTTDARIKNFRAEIAVNPIDETARIVVHSKVSGSVNLSITNMAGQKLISGKHFMSEGRNEILVDAVVLKSGIYLFTIESEGEAASGKMMVQH